MEYVHDLGKGRATGEPTLSHKEKFLQLLNALGYFLTRYERLLLMKHIKMNEIREVTPRPEKEEIEEIKVRIKT